MRSDDRDEILDEHAVAALLGVTNVTLQGWRRRRCGPPYFKLGHKIVRYRRSAIRDWMRSCERLAESNGEANVAAGAVA